MCNVWNGAFGTFRLTRPMGLEPGMGQSFSKLILNMTVTPRADEHRTPSVMTISMWSPSFSRDFLENLEITHLIEKCQTGLLEGLKIEVSISQHRGEDKSKGL